MKRWLGILLAVGVWAEVTPEQQLARSIFKELIEINTTDSVGDNTRAAEAMAARLRTAGFPAEDVQVLAPAPRKGNLVARLRGSGHARPVLLLAHLDVVEARREDWSFDPFTFREQDGYFYGRGTQDIKSEAALWVTNMIRLKREGFVPDRDLIVALTADEEGGAHNGVQWLLHNHRDLIDAAYCINADAGGGQISHGRRLMFSVQQAEKTYVSFRLTVKNRGGHSSLPTKDNAIYRLAEGLTRLEKFDFPVKLNEVTHTFLERMSGIEKGRTAADMKAVLETPPDPQAVARLSEQPFYNAVLRTTCVATMLSGGHAENALPQSAEAVVNCRVLPNDSPDEVERTLHRVVADPQIGISRIQPAEASPVSPFEGGVFSIVEKTADSMWPGIPVIPVMETGATDGKWLRIAGIPTYGVSGIFYDVDDIRAHGKDERTPVEAFYEGLEFGHRLMKALGQSR